MVIEDGINTHGVLVLNAAAQGNYYEEILAIKCHCAVSVDSKNRILMRQKWEQIDWEIIIIPLK